VLFYIIVGAVAGGIAGAIAKLAGPRIAGLSRNAQWQRHGATVVAALVAVILFVVGITTLSGYASRLGGESGPSQEAQILDQIHRYHFVQVLEKYQPETKKQIEDYVHEAVTRNEPGLVEQRTRELVQTYFPRYVPVTSDDAIVGFGTAMLGILEYLGKNDVAVCKTLATGGQLGKAIDPQHMQPTLDAMSAVIEDGASKPQAKPDTQHAQALIQQVFTTVYAGNDPDLLPQTQLTTPAQAPADKLCHTMQAFYRTVLALPKADASAVLRTLIGARS
jgi:hypothetical protein